MEFMIWFYTKGFILLFALLICAGVIGYFIKFFWAKPGELGPEPKCDWTIDNEKSEIDPLSSMPPHQSLEEKFDMRLTNIFRRWDE